MNKFIMVAILVAMGATSAMACDGPQPKGCNCDPKTNTWVTTVNGINGNISAGATAGATATSTAGATATNTSNNTNNNSNVANGGAGGQGGKGGNATATGGSATIAKGAVTNNVSQGQGQSQTQTNTVSNSGNATIGNVGSTSSVGNVSTGASTSDASASNNGNGSNNTTINTEYRAAKIPVATAYSASLTSGIDTCLGSASGGAQTQILGLTFGKTYVDKNCILIKQTHLLREVDQDRAACFRMQQGKEGEAIRQAMKDAGAECPPLVATAVTVVQPLPPTDAVSHSELAEVEKRIVQKVTQK